jgi:hypothetical protein
MKYKALKIDSDNYDEGTFKKVRVVLDRMDAKAYGKKYDEAIAYGSLALERLKSEPDVSEIYNIINDAIARVTLESMRNVK